MLLSTARTKMADILFHLLKITGSKITIILYSLCIMKQNTIKEWVCVGMCVCVCGQGCDMCVWGSHMHPHTYPGQWCLRRLPEEDLCRAGTHSVPHRRVTHWTETPGVRCQRNSPAGTGCPSELWGYMWDRDSEDTEYRDINMRHGVRRKKMGSGDRWEWEQGIEKDEGEARREWGRDVPGKGSESAALLWAFSLIE